MSDTLLATKIRVPPVRGNLIKRPHLIQRLNDGIAQHHCLTLVSAPAGYGKSTLLSEWVSQIDIPVAWLSLEKTENSPPRFWSYFGAALSSIPHFQQAGIGEATFLAIHSAQPPPVEILLADLLNELSRFSNKALLVLDDLHTISEGQIHRDLVYLIDHLPQCADNFFLVVASRMDPPWPLARWRVNNSLTEQRAKDLRFSMEEVTAYLNEVMKLTLEIQDIKRLEQRTEGWIAGLQMAALSMHRQENIANFLDEFSGTHHFILDYLLEEVLNQQEPDLLDFLLRTSLLDYLTAPLCDAITDRKDSQAILLRLEKSNMFLVPLDDVRQWFRYHHLFAELLNKRIKQMQPDRVREVHQRASRWFAESDLLPEAVIHAVQARDYLYVSNLISGNTLAILEHTELDEVLRYFDEIPKNEFSLRPWLWVAYAWLIAYSDPSTGFEPVIERAEKCVADVENDAERHHLIGHLVAIRAYVAWVKGRSEEALEFTNEALEHIPENDRSTRCHVLHIQGAALQYLDRLPEAIKSFEASITVGQRTGRSQETLLSNHSLAYTYYLQGKLHQAFSICQQVLNIAEKTDKGIKPNSMLAQVYSTLGLIQFEWKELDTAITSARKAVNLAEQWNQVDSLHYALNTLSKALCAAGCTDEAFSIHHRAIRLAENVSPWFFMLSLSTEIQLYLAKGDISLAIHKFEGLESRWDEKMSDTILFTKALLQYEQGLTSDLLITLEAGIADVRNRGEIWFLMRLLPLQALALNALGRQEEALSSIAHCLDLAESEGYVRIFVERGALMLGLLQMAASQGIHAEYINQLLPAFKIAKISRKSTAGPVQLKDQSPVLHESLSEREHQVLRLLDSSLTSVEIGRELYLSQNTVRTHIRNIYSKLGVHGRIEAIQKAKDLDLI